MATEQEDRSIALPIYQRDSSRATHPEESYYGFGLEGEALDQLLFGLSSLITKEWGQELSRPEEIRDWQHYARVYNRVHEAIDDRELAKGTWQKAVGWRQLPKDDRRHDAGVVITNYHLTRSILLGAHRVIKNNPEFFGGRSKYSLFDKEDAMRLEAQFARALTEDQFMDEMFIQGLSKVDEKIADLSQRDHLDQLPMAINNITWRQGFPLISARSGLPITWIQKGVHRDIAFFGWEYKQVNRGEVPTDDEIKASLGIHGKESLALAQGLIAGSLPIRVDPKDISFMAETLEELDGRIVELAASDYLVPKELEDWKRQLTDREIEVLSSRYGLNGKQPQTLDQVGELLGRTKERIRQIELKAIGKLRKP